MLDAAENEPTKFKQTLFSSVIMVHMPNCLHRTMSRRKLHRGSLETVIVTVVLSDIAAAADVLLAGHERASAPEARRRGYRPYRQAQRSLRHEQTVLGNTAVSRARNVSLSAKRSRPSRGG